MKIYGDLTSGNCLKVKLVLNLLNLEANWLHIDLAQGQTQDTAFKGRFSVKCQFAVIYDLFVTNYRRFRVFCPNRYSRMPKNTVAAVTPTVVP